MKIKMLCFDMDGTLVDFYGVDNWLNMGKNEDTTPYKIAKPLWDMDILIQLLQKAREQGIEIRIITWLWAGGSAEFNERTKKAKKEWLAKYNFPFDNFHGIKYGTTKADSIRKYLAEGETAIIFDDSEKVRRGWNMGEAVNPQTENIIEYLQGIL